MSTSRCEAVSVQHAEWFVGDGCTVQSWWTVQARSSDCVWVKH